MTTKNFILKQFFKDKKKKSFQKQELSEYNSPEAFNKSVKDEFQ